MSQPINLLPTDLARGKEVTKALSYLRSLSIVLCTLVLFITLGGLIFVFLGQKDITERETVRDGLRSQVLALETSERELVLMRDRLGKIAQIRSTSPLTTFFNAQKTILAAAPPEVTIDEVEINTSASTLTLASDTIIPFQNLVTQLLNSQYSKPLAATSLTFDSISGYRLVLGVY